MNLVTPGTNDPPEIVVHINGEQRKGEWAARPFAMAIESWAYGWQWRAACRGEDSSTFFPADETETKDERITREQRAKSICSGCSVRIECLEYSLSVPELYGVWGGLNETERRALLRERRAS